jgi:hypothetical protein
MLYDIFAYSH